MYLHAEFFGLQDQLQVTYFPLTKGERTRAGGDRRSPKSDASGDALSHDPKYCPENCASPGFHAHYLYAQVHMCINLQSLPVSRRLQPFSLTWGS